MQARLRGTGAGGGAAAAVEDDPKEKRDASDMDADWMQTQSPASGWPADSESGFQALAPE